jgi:hypothetical protein
MDEKGFRLACGRRMRRMVAPFRKRESGSKEARQRESLTVIECINTQGKYVEPTVIYEGTAGPLCGWFREAREDDFWYGNSKSGFNNTAIMIEWIQLVFESDTRPDDPDEWRLLIFAGFEAHLDPDVVDFALDNNIICFSLPSHCTHEGQPLFKAVLGPLENAYAKLARNIQSSQKNAFRSFMLSLGGKPVQKTTRLLALKLTASTHLTLPRFWKNAALLSRPSAKFGIF